MKLLLCCNCGDIVELNWSYKTCECGNTAGFYIDKENIVYSGNDAIVLGIHNESLRDGVLHRPLDGRGYYLYAWVIPYYCASTIKVDRALWYFENRKHLEVSLHEQWTDAINKIRVKNPFLKFIYSIFKKFMFPALKEDEMKKLIECGKTDNSAFKSDNSAFKSDNNAFKSDNKSLSSCYTKNK